MLQNVPCVSMLLSSLQPLAKNVGLSLICRTSLYEHAVGIIGDLLGGREDSPPNTPASSPEILPI